LEYGVTAIRALHKLTIDFRHGLATTSRLFKLATDFEYGVTVITALHESTMDLRPGLATTSRLFKLTIEFGRSEQLHTVLMADSDDVGNADNSAQGSDCKTI